MTVLPPGGREMVAEPAEMSIEGLVAQVQKIQQAIRAVFVDGEHYGVIPGTQPRKGADGKPLPPKNVLLKAGAEKLCLLFRLAVDYTILNRVDEQTFIYREVKASLTHIPTGNVMGAGVGSCSSREEKYGFRRASRSCPKCGKEAILKSKNEGEGYFCWRKKDGCGATFQIGDRSIEDQEVGKVANENIWDSENTISKMACKRALIAAVLNATAASDLFTQDLEDSPPMAATNPTGSAHPPVNRPPAGSAGTSRNGATAGGGHSSGPGAAPASHPGETGKPKPDQTGGKPSAGKNADGSGQLSTQHDPVTGEVRPSERSQHIKIFAKCGELGHKGKDASYLVIEKIVGHELIAADGKKSIKVLTHEEADRVYAELCKMAGPPDPTDADAPPDRAA